MDAGGKRLLPIWMHKRNAPEARRELENDESRLALQGQVQTQASWPKVKTTAIEAREELTRQETNDLDEIRGSFFQGRTIKESRKSSRLDWNPRNSRHINSGLLRRKAPERKAAASQSMLQERSAYEKPKEIINETGPSDFTNLEPVLRTKNEDDVELTVEDLMSIAEEYVNVGEEKHQWQAPSEESKSQAYGSSSSVYANNKFGVLSGAAESSAQISKCTTTTYCSDQSSIDMVKSAPLYIPRTGDAAQDMLDLFLGPLLRMPAQGKQLERTQRDDIHDHRK